jgi:hypothetical protein
MWPTSRTRHRTSAPPAISTGKGGWSSPSSASPGANIIDTVDRVKAQLPFLEAVLPAGVKTTVDMDRTVTIRASVKP